MFPHKLKNLTILIKRACMKRLCVGGVERLLLRAFMVPAYHSVKQAWWFTKNGQNIKQTYYYCIFVYDYKLQTTGDL